MGRQFMHNRHSGSRDDRFRVDFCPGGDQVGAVGGRCTVRIVSGLPMHIIIRDLQIKGG